MEKRRLINNNNVAIMGLSNFGGLVIELDNNGDTGRAQFDFGEGSISDIKDISIEYLFDEDEEMEGLGFELDNEVYFLHDFIRKNI